MPICHTPQMRSIQLSQKSRTNGSATFQTVQTVGRPLLPGRPMTLCQVDEHTSRDYATSHSWCATHSLSKRPSFSAWWHFWPPGNGTHPLDHFLCFLVVHLIPRFISLHSRKPLKILTYIRRQLNFQFMKWDRCYIAVALYKYHKSNTGILYVADQCLSHFNQKLVKLPLVSENFQHHQSLKRWLEIWL